MLPGSLEALYGPFKRIRKWTSGPIGPVSVRQATAITTSAITVSPLESVADTHTV
jgi:hypothetical protein